MYGYYIRAAVIISLFCFGHSALAATEISGNLEGDQIWTKDKSPYIITDKVIVGTEESPANLTLEPGTIVKFQPQTWLAIMGNLVANGSEADAIYFTSNKNDSVYGGTNEESTEATAFDDWSLVILDSSESEITNTYFSYSLGGIQVLDSTLVVNDLLLSNSATALIADNSTITIRDTKIDNADTLLVLDSTANVTGLSMVNTGILLSNSTFSLDNSSIDETDAVAMAIYESEVDIHDTNFTNGLSSGLEISDSDISAQDVKITSFQYDGVITYGNTVFTGKNLNISHNFNNGITNYATSNISRSKIYDNTAGVVNYGSLQVTGSAIDGNLLGVQAHSYAKVSAMGNYWGDPTGPYNENLNPEGMGDPVSDYVNFTPYSRSYCESNCHSNIMFLPGIMSSRLYEGDNQLWEPGALTKDSEFEALYLDETGTSINPNIYTKDVLDNGYAYGKFVEDLANMKVSGTINDYEAVPYDWRLSMDNVLSNGVKNDDGTILYDSATTSPYIELTLRRLAANSKSGKVTIVAHSNGGLVTKALINKLGGEAAELIDKVILVAVPQLGTPQAIGSLLHGYNAGLPSIYPFVLSPERARDLAINMPMIYQLMPFADYYSGEGATVGTPYVTFEDGSATQSFIDKYGYAITPGELADFLSGTEGRVAAGYDDLENPTNANTTLLGDAMEMQQEINSSWNAPNGIEVHQIAGTGEETLASITYQTIQDCAERNILHICVSYEDTLSYKPNPVIDGDGTVVAPSALAMSDSSENVKRWWVNLDEYNDIFAFNKDRAHADLLEINELREFILNNLITATTKKSPEYISSTIPELEPKDRLNFTLHSPLALSAIDSAGNIISAEKAEIPGANYTRYGEVQVLSMPIDIEFDLVLTGEATGSFTLAMEEIIEDEAVATSTFSAIPSSTSTKAIISFADEGLEEAGKLQVDYDGDSIIDLTYTPVLSETVSTPDAVTNTTGSSGGAIGGYISPQPQVLGVSINLEQLIKLIEQLQLSTHALESFKDKIPQEQYVEINSQLLEITNKINTLLKGYNI